MKKCAVCKEEKSKSEFNKHNKRKDGLQSHCRECNRARSRRYYNENKEHHRVVTRKRNRANYIKLKKQVDSLKQKCSMCDETERCCLDFHHVDPSIKENNILYFVRALSIDKLNEELAKCIVVCANCHRKIHAGLIQL